MNALAHAKIEYAKQLAALPWRVSDDGQLEIMMVTSRISRHWLIPKGWPMAGKSDSVAALQEAFEEAGIKGKAASKPIGRYTYVKLMKDGTSVPCIVKVYGMKVIEELAAWPEMAQRERRWFTPEQAAAAVTETGLAQFLASLTMDYGKTGKPVRPVQASKAA